jgi:hypothetical protein
MEGEPLAPQKARRLLQEIVREGSVRFSGHALAEMKKDDLSTQDCLNVLRGGVVEPPELRDGTWRYRVRTARIYVVVAFRSEKSCVVVSAWRLKK